MKISKKKRKTQVSKIKNEWENLQLQKTTMNNYTLANSITSEIDKFLETESLSRMNHKEIKCIPMPITSEKIED